MTDIIPEQEVSEPASTFSVFEGDLLNRAFACIGLGSKGVWHTIGRILFIISITWLPMALITWHQGVPEGAGYSQNFFYDFAAYAQFFIGLPLFIIAERVIGTNLLSAARDFAQSGVIAPEDMPKLREIEREVERKRKKPAPEIICLILAFILSCMTIGPELVLNNGAMKTWHSYQHHSGAMRLTYAGAWEMFVALPIQIFWWLRWMWKIGLWYWYLQRISRFKLVLVASHPDHTGGISFLSEVQAKFAIIILAFGISNIVATVGYKIGIEHAPITLPPVWGPVVGFVIGAPLLFLSPLLLFTKQLARTKKRALDQFRQKAMLSARKVEQSWLHEETDLDSDAKARTELSQLNLLTGFYERISKMRVVPFDLRSAAQLIGSAVGPMVPVLPYFVNIPTPWQKLLEGMMKWLPH